MKKFDKLNLDEKLILAKIGYAYLQQNQQINMKEIINVRSIKQ